MIYQKILALMVAPVFPDDAEKTRISGMLNTRSLCWTTRRLTILHQNAVKFMGTQPEPGLEIGARERSDIGEVVFFVKDNGIGIKSQFQAKVFDLFERLDPSIEGTGVGLALVKRIIEVHNGRIWIESDGNYNGSTFCFTLSTTIKENNWCLV